MTTLAKKITSSGIVEWREDAGRFTVFNVTGKRELLRLERHSMRAELLAMRGMNVTGAGLQFLRAEREREQIERQTVGL